MSFWKFNFTSAPEVSIDSILDRHVPHPSPPAPAPSTSTSPSSSSSPTSLNSLHTTLDALLDSPDLLSELKANQNVRLRELLAEGDVVRRLGGWVVWGLGRPRADGIVNGGIVADDVMDGKVPDEIVVGDTKTAGKGTVGMGAVQTRRDMDQFGVLEGNTPETEQEKAKAGSVTFIIDCDRCLHGRDAD